MSFEELLLLLLFLSGLLVALLGPAALILAVWTLVRVRRIERQLARLEAERVPQTGQPVRSVAESGQPPQRLGWFRRRLPKLGSLLNVSERYIGQRILPWIAVLALLVGIAYLLRQAIRLGLLGPFGQFAMAVVLGTALWIAGCIDRWRGRRLRAQFVLAAGAVVLYVALYAGCGYYRFYPVPVGLAALTALWALALALAALMNSSSMAYLATVGALLVPVLFRSPVDQYSLFFSYLGVIEAVVVFTAVFRRWPGLTVLALVGGHVDYWLWHTANYHPAKAGAVLVLHTFLLFLFAVRSLAGGVVWSSLFDAEEYPRAALAVAFYCLAVQDAIEPTALQTAAVLVPGCLYAGAGWLAARLRPRSPVPAAWLPVVLGSLAWAWALLAQAPWLALGWAVVGATSWWLGVTISVGLLQALGIGFAGAAIVRLFAVDIHASRPWPYWPLVHPIDAAGWAVPVVLLVGAIAVRPTVAERSRYQRFLNGLLVAMALAALWAGLTAELRRFFFRWAEMAGREDIEAIHWAAQVATSSLWAAFATGMLWSGWRYRSGSLRWAALALYAVTTTKVFVWDMAAVGELYRAMAALALAALVGWAAWRYHMLSKGSAHLDAPRTVEAARAGNG